MSSCDDVLTGTFTESLDEVDDTDLGGSPASFK
jgi:hypothetical protein